MGLEVFFEKVGSLGAADLLTPFLRVSSSISGFLLVFGLFVDAFPFLWQHTDTIDHNLVDDSSNNLSYIPIQPTH